MKPLSLILAATLSVVGIAGAGAAFVLAQPADSDIAQSVAADPLAALRAYVMDQNGTEQPFDNEFWDHHEAGIFYRRPTANRWLYWSVEPLVRWDRAYRWSADPGIRIGIEALFWDLARR